MAFFLPSRLELARTPIWRLGTQRPPAGRLVPLSKGRELFVREAENGPRSPRRKAPPVLLLHGWLASGGLNWLRAFEPLASRYRLCAPDLHGHASSDAPRRKRAGQPRFSIERCADEMAELLEILYPGEPALVVGYSLGGMVAQALWRRHPLSVSGLVLGATSAAPIPVSRGRRPFMGLVNAARESSILAGHLAALPWAISQSVTGTVAGVRNSSLDGGESDTRFTRLRETPLLHWAPSEFARHHWPTVLDAGRAIAEFDAREWIGEVDVPTSILLTERDGLIPATQQEAMAQEIRHAHVQRVDAGHFACLRDDFGARLLASCKAVEKVRGKLA